MAALAADRTWVCCSHWAVHCEKPGVRLHRYAAYIVMTSSMLDAHNFQVTNADGTS
jgi:hypothetical protein